MRHKIYLDTRMKRKSGEYPLRVALTYEGRRMYVATGICVAPCHWDPRSERVTGHPHQHQFNMMLGKIRMDVDGLCLSLMGQDLPFDEVKRRLSCTVSGEDWTRLDKPKLMEQYLRFAQEQRNERTRKQYLFTMERIRRFDAACDELLLEDITAEWLMRYEAFLSLTMRSANSRSIHLRNLRAVMNDAITRELTTNYPFRRFKIKSEPTRHRALTVEELRDLWRTDVHDWEREYLDMFKLMFLLCGLAPVDLFSLPDDAVQRGRITTKRSKTGQSVSVRVEPEAMEIIERNHGEQHLVRAMDRVQDYRNYLHKMTKALKTMGGVTYEPRAAKDGKVRAVAVRRVTWPELSPYWARHTWATIAYSIGVSVDVIAQAMGHSQRRVTDIYIARDSSLVDEANRRVIDYVLGTQQTPQAPSPWCGDYTIQYT